MHIASRFLALFSMLASARERGDFHSSMKEISRGLLLRGEMGPYRVLLDWKTIFVMLPTIMANIASPVIDLVVARKEQLDRFPE